MRDDDKGRPAPEQGAGVQLGAAQEVLPTATPEEIIFAKLPESLVARIKHGSPDSRWLVEQISDLLTPDELRCLLYDESNLGLTATYGIKLDDAAADRKRKLKQNTES